MDDHTGEEEVDDLGELAVDPAVAVAIEAPGVDEEAVLPWSLLLRRGGSGNRRPRLGPRSPRSQLSADDLAGRPGWWR